MPLTNLSSEVVALLDAPGLDNAHASPHVVLLDAPGQETHLVPGIRLLKDLVEHLDACYLPLAVPSVANHFDFLSNLTKGYSFHCKVK